MDLNLVPLAILFFIKKHPGSTTIDFLNDNLIMKRFNSRNSERKATMMCLSNICLELKASGFLIRTAKHEDKVRNIYAYSLTDQGEQLISEITKHFGINFMPNNIQNVDSSLENRADPQISSAQTPSDPIVKSQTTSTKKATTKNKVLANTEIHTKSIQDKPKTPEINIPNLALNNTINNSKSVQNNSVKTPSPMVSQKPPMPIPSPSPNRPIIISAQKIYLTYTDDMQRFILKTLRIGKPNSQQEAMVDERTLEMARIIEEGFL